MRFFKLHKKAVITLVSCLLIGAGVVGTYATLTAVTGSVVNKFTGEEINTSITEEFPPQDVTPGTTLKKDVKITNDGPSDAFIRARVTISPDKAVEFLGTDDKWSYSQKDGWFYYKEVVAVGDSTTSIMTNIKLPSTLSENFDVTVYQEAVGTGKYKPGDDVPITDIQDAFNNVTKH